MAISEKKMKIVIDNYFKSECDVNTSIREAFEKGFRIGVNKASAQPEIIRCKDCQYQSKGQNECETWNLCGYRPWQYTPTTDEHFCGYAERREE